jgi:hypothetical protein
MTNKNGKKKGKNFKEVSCFEVLPVLFRRLKASPVAGMVLHELQIFDHNLEFFSAVNLYKFWSSKPWIRNLKRIRIDLKCWIQIRAA